ncbi:hypothetical protein Fcan01_16931 [Folsomia candida]|uniref:Gustatory receptor n=1 Tax=Folsomia candida TaxID=158441 RepID=A0A226DT53_FOLCA|nr:hypothetical protein Fcan01_16931 [Folsomia candida]
MKWLEKPKISLFQILFVSYYPFGYKPCVEIITDKRGVNSVRKTKRKFDKVLSCIPIACLSVTWISCGFAIFIVAIESKTRLEMVLNPKVWSWCFGLLLASCCSIVYKVWIVDDIDLSVKMANEVLKIERELVEGSRRRWNRSSTRFQFFDWFTISFYLQSPILVSGVISADAEPFLFLVKYFLVKFDPNFTFVTRLLLPGYGKIFQLILLLLSIWPIVNLVVYELSRILILYLSGLINASQKASNILHTLQKKVRRNGVFFHKKYFLYYSRLRIISQSVYSEVMIFMVQILAVLGMVICTSTFIVVRLHGKFSIQDALLTRERGHS